MVKGKGKGRGKFRKKREKPEFDQQIVDLARVTRVTKGGKQMSFRACVVIGDRKGRVGYGIEKGKDVQIAVEKAVNQAKKNLLHVPMMKGTIPHRVDAKFGAAKVMIKPAPKGSGVIAGSSVRVVIEMAGIPNASAKVMGKTNNKVNNVKAAFVCLQSFLPKAVELANKVNKTVEKKSSASKSSIKVVELKKKKEIKTKKTITKKTTTEKSVEAKKEIKK
jgi:small subunit ribosomal protein S5